MDVGVLSREEDIPKDEVIESMINSAVAALRLGMYEEGMARFEEIMEVGTTSFKLLGTIYMWYGRVSRKLKLHDKALDFFEHELNTYRLTVDIAAAYDASRRIAELSLKVGKFSKAKRTAEEFLDYTISKKGDSFVQKARALLASICLEGYEQKMEQNPDELKKLLIVSREQLNEAKLLSGDASDITIMMLEAKWAALSGSQRESRDAYQKCVDCSIKSKDFSFVHRAYYEMATFAEGTALLCIIHDLRSALFYATNYGTEREVTRYKIELAKKLFAFGNAHEAYLHGAEALKLARKQKSNSSITKALLVISQCLSFLGENSQAAYFLVLGSAMSVRQENVQTEACEKDKENQQVDEKLKVNEEFLRKNRDLEDFYQKIDSLMTTFSNERVLPTEAEQVGELQLPVDASLDMTPDETAAKFVVKLEHTTTLETWRMAVNDVFGVSEKKPVKKEEKENEEPLDFMDLIAKMNHRMDDQRTELPAAMFNRPRPLSSASSRKTVKSYRILPGLRTSLARLHDVKIDRQVLNKMLKRSKKSKVSIHSNSTQGDDTRSDVTVDDSILTTSK